LAIFHFIHQRQSKPRRIRRQAAGAAPAPSARLDAADSFRYLALTLDRKATHSGFYRRIDYPPHGVV
jgi:hypothetical protein